jgi:hypothetical protein
MGFFRRAEVEAAPQTRHFTVHYLEKRPSWMHDGMEMTLLDGGHEDLAVVGESHRQEALWIIVGGRHGPEVRVRMDIFAALLPETGNPYDPNAVAVWISGFHVGYLPREEAPRYRPGLIALQEEHGQPVALPGVIIGGGMRDDGPGNLGVFLSHNPEDFGLPGKPEIPYADARLRKAVGEELAVSKGCPYSLTWMHGLETDGAHAIQVLRKALATESDLIGRHFIYSELEAALYRCREVFASALEEYDQVCRQHDAEMEKIRPACMAQWGKVPVVEVYKQMAIRQQKAHDYAQALWWAERGIAFYGDDAARPEVVKDLQGRAAKYRLKVAG